MHISRPEAAVAGVLTLMLAACSGAGPDAASGTDGADATDAGAAAVTVAATDALAFEPETLDVPAGTVEVRLTAEAGVGHSFVIDGVQDDAPIASADAGETATGTVELNPGSYTFYCAVPGHRAAGMDGTVNAT